MQSLLHRPDCRQRNPHLEEVAERVPVKRAGLDAVGLVVSLLGQPLGLIGVDDGLAGPQVGFFGLDSLGLVDDLVAEDHQEVERDALLRNVLVGVYEDGDL